METTLRPLTLGEILDRTAELYRSNFLLLAGISSVYGGILLVLSLLQIGAQQAAQGHAPEHWPDRGVGGWPGHSLPRHVCSRRSGGRGQYPRCGLGSSGRAGQYRRCLSRHPAANPALPLAHDDYVLPRMVPLRAHLCRLCRVDPCLCASHRDYLPPHAPPPDPRKMVVFLASSVAFLFLLLGSLIYGIIMSLRYSLAVPACTVENLAARAAIRRSIQLSKGSRGRIFMLGLLALIIQLGLPASPRASSSLWV